MEMNVYSSADITKDILDSECAYLSGLTASTEYHHLNDIPIFLAESYFNKGWRRFGKMFFRPSCNGCSSCMPLRVNPQKFKPSKSQRRVLKKNSHIKIIHTTPQCTLEKMKLHDKYHKRQHEQKNWPFHAISSIEYKMLFCEQIKFASEHQYYDGDKLVGIGYVDLLHESLSSVYFFYDPEWSHLSPGTFSALKELELAQELELAYYHLGYYVHGCPSMSYKKNFSPYEFLRGSQDEWEWTEAHWESPKNKS